VGGSPWIRGLPLFSCAWPARAPPVAEVGRGACDAVDEQAVLARV